MNLEKNKTMRILLLCLLVLAAACSEIPPMVNPISDNPVDPGDTSSVQNQPRQVLIEEFSGVRCVNCPAGSAAIKNLLSIHGEKLWAISIHAGFFARKYPESRYDFRTPDGDNLLSFLGEPLGYPTAVVNRRLFPGEGDLQLGQPDWPGYIIQELNSPPAVRIGLNTSFDPLSRELTATVELLPDQNIAQADLRLSVALTEDNIVDRQLTPQGEKDDYVHQWVLRDMLSNFDGNPLPTPLISGQRLSRSFRYTLPAGWVEKNCALIAFVHLGGAQKDVLQVHGVKIIK